MTLADLLPDEDYRFHMRFERGAIRDFFAPTPAHDQLLAQRRHWLQTAPETYAALLPEAIPLLEEAISVARNTATVDSSDCFSPGAISDHWNLCLSLGSAWEPDYLLLKADAGGQMRLLGGCVCFPSSWSLREKLGHPISFIHGVVPNLNQALGQQINTFLGKLKPGIAWLRANWGLSRSPELNQHPDRLLPRLDGNLSVDEIWFRSEHQALVALPQSQGLLFGIRIEILPLKHLQQNPALASRFARALKTMPEPMAQYKNIAPVRERLIALLGSA